MANTNVPGTPVLVRFDGDEAMIEWATPARSGYTWNVYASLSGTPPLAGPPLGVDLQKQQYSVFAPSIVGNSPPVNNFYVAVTSTNSTTGQESAQSAPLLVSSGSVAGGDDAGNAVLPALDPSGKFTALRVGTDGSLAASVTGLPLPSGAATAANQATEITSLSSIDGKTPTLGQAPMASSSPVVIASNQSRVPTAESFTLSVAPTVVPVGAASVPLPAVPMVGRRSLVLFNSGTSDVLLGIGGSNFYPLPKNTPAVLDVTDSVLVTASRPTGSGDVVAWEFA